MPQNKIERKIIILQSCYNMLIISYFEVYTISKKISIFR